MLDKINILDKVLHYLGKNKENVFLVQVGAMDGISYDDVAGYSRMYNWDGLYVEPIPYLFNKLVKSKKDTDLFEQAAIVEENKEVQMITIDPDVIEAGKIHHGFSGMSAVIPPKNGFAHDNDRPIMEEYGKLITVTGITLSTLLDKYNINNLDIFLCDAEGLDWSVFKQLDLDTYRPKALRFEIINLNSEEKQHIIDKFNCYNYVYEISGQDIDATPKEFWEEIENYASKE